MPDMKPYEWFADRIEPARTEEDGFFGACPVHGGSDSLHVTRKNGRALIKCFACGAGYREVVAALEATPEDSEAPQSDEGAKDGDTPTMPTVTRVRRSSAAPAGVPEVGTPGQLDALQWYADYVGVDIAFLKADIPVRASADNAWVQHYWDGFGVTKDRAVVPGIDGKYARRWSERGAQPPLVWPSPATHPFPPEIWLCEGETDVIALRVGYGLPAYTAGSATTLPDEDQLRVVRAMGVESVVIAYDGDKPGRLASKELVESARAAGLIVYMSEPSHPVVGGVKDWVEWWKAYGIDYPPVKGAAGTELDVHVLKDVPASQHEKLLLDRLHATDHTILFGDGGTGKGVVAAWWAARLTDELQMSVLVLDYESHARGEWRPRIEAFNGKLERVLIVQPDRPIWDIASSVRELIKERSIDYVMVDSAMYACAGADAYKPEAATQYSLAIAQFQRPVLTLAHKTKSKDDDSKYPFGSVFWHNGARLTISIDAKDYDDPRVLRTRKASQGAEFNVEIEWEWVSRGLPKTLTETEVARKKTTQAERIRLAMVRLGGEGTLAAIAVEVENDGEGPMPPATAKNLLSNRMNDASESGGVWKLGAAVTVTRQRRGTVVDPAN